MLIDSRKVPIGEIINTEVCIVGAGPRDIFTNEYRHQINQSPNITHSFFKLVLLACYRMLHKPAM
ncbi:MAG: hypothetical protein V7K43_25820 [Nostoc sp.]